jgi:hypothetical protein
MKPRVGQLVALGLLFVVFYESGEYGLVALCLLSVVLAPSVAQLGISGSGVLALALLPRHLLGALSFSLDPLGVAPLDKGVDRLLGVRTGGEHAA